MAKQHDLARRRLEDSHYPVGGPMSRVTGLVSKICVNCQTNWPCDVGLALEEIDNHHYQLCPLVEVLANSKAWYDESRNLWCCQYCDYDNETPRNDFMKHSVAWHDVDCPISQAFMEVSMWTRDWKS